MTSPPKVFLDSDVIISSLLSQTGAAHLLIRMDNLPKCISTISYRELQGVTKRLSIPTKSLDELIQKNLQVISINDPLPHIKKIYSRYIFDPNDAHIVAGAASAKAKFLITYNLKHFNVDQIKQGLSIITYKPATFLQYLRSRQKN